MRRGSCLRFTSLINPGFDQFILVKLINYIYIYFYHFSNLRCHGYLKSFLMEHKNTYLSMGADDLVTQGTSTSATMVFTSLSQNIPIQHQIVFCGIHPRAFSQEVLYEFNLKHVLQDYTFKIISTSHRGQWVNFLFGCLITLVTKNSAEGDTMTHSNHHLHVNWMESLIGNTPLAPHYNSQTENWISNISLCLTQNKVYLIWSYLCKEYTAKYIYNVIYDIMKMCSS